MKKFALLLINIVLLGMISCSNEAPPKQEEEQVVTKVTKDMLEKDYTYLEDLKVYLNDNISKDFSFKTVDSVMFIPLNSCASCVSFTINALSINPFSGKIIVGGNPSDYSEYEKHLSNMRDMNPQFYIDTATAMFDYRIGINGPALLTKSNDSWKIIELSIADWPLIIDFIDWKTPDYDFKAKH